MKKAVVLLSVLALLVNPPLLSSPGEQTRTEQKDLRDIPKKDDTGLDKLMRRKLAQAQKVLEGIAVQDFEKIAGGADELMIVSKQAEWRVVKTPRYELYSNEFRRTLDDMRRHAQAKNLDAAALSYVDMTLTCVRCHKYVREVRMTRLEEGAGHAEGRGVGLVP